MLNDCSEKHRKVCPEEKINKNFTQKKSPSLLDVMRLYSTFMQHSQTLLVFLHCSMSVQKGHHSVCVCVWRLTERGLDASIQGLLTSSGYTRTVCVCVCVCVCGSLLSARLLSLDCSFLCCKGRGEKLVKYIFGFQHR